MKYNLMKRMTQNSYTSLMLKQLNGTNISWEALSEKNRCKSTRFMEYCAATSPPLPHLEPAPLPDPYKCSAYYIQSASSRRLSKYFWCFSISLISWIPSKILRNPTQILHITIPELCWSKAFTIKSTVYSTMYAWSYQIFSKRKRRGRGYHTCSCWAMLVRRQGVWRTCAPAWSLAVAPGNTCAWIWWLPSTWSSSGSRLPNKSDSMDMMQFAKPIEHSMDQGRTSSRHLSSHRTLNPF